MRFRVWSNGPVGTGDRSWHWQMNGFSVAATHVYGVRSTEYRLKKNKSASQTNGISTLLLNRYFVQGLCVRQSKHVSQ